MELNNIIENHSFEGYYLHNKRINKLNQNNKYPGKELLRGIINNDAGILDYVYKENFRAVRHLIITNSGTEEDASDIFQESLVVLFRKIRDKNFELTSSLNTFIYSIARLTWLKELENRNKRVEFVDTDDSFQDKELEVIDVIERNEKLRLYREKFEELSDNCKKVLRMFLNSIPIKEITKTMGYSSDQHTKNRRFRCKKSLISKIRKSSKYKELGNEKNKDDRDIPRW